MEKKRVSTWVDFFRDSRDIFSAFTVISLGAGATLVSSPLIIRLMNWPSLTRDEIGSLTLIYCISALSDALLGIYLNKAPDSVALNQQFGEGAKNEQQLPPDPEKQEA